ncbi:MAG: protein rep [Acidimicrobiia bacterium]|nr:protein rep [Acidimicrobiia bacterium]
MTATGTARRSTGDAWLDAVAATEDAERRRHERLVLEDRVQRLNRQLLGPRRDPETGEWSKKHRAGTCGLPHGERVEMGYVAVPDGLDTGQLRGVVVCAAANLCMRCAIKIAAARARQIELLAAVMKALGFHCYMFTPTFSHARSDGLALSYQDMMDAWTSLRQSRLFRKLTADGGGFCRQVEVTWSLANGFHPHLHVLVWSKLNLSGQGEWGRSEIDEMEHNLWREWSAQMAKAGRTVSEEHGITLIRADDPAMGRYLAKVGLELTMGPLKTGRHASWSMWDIAATAMDPDPDITDEVRARCRALWAEYAAVVGGRRMFATSHGLLKRAGVEELDEQDEAERQQGEFTPYVAADAGVYSAADKAGVVPELKGLLSSRTAPELLATVLTRRLGRAIVVKPPEDDVALPLLRWGCGGTT